MTELLKKPDTSSNLALASNLQLVRQGLSLHFASLWGPLRTSKAYRKNNQNWFMFSIKRFLSEYGLNLSLFGIEQIFIFYYFPNISLWLELLAVASLPFLTVVQMFIDHNRKDSKVYYHANSSTGMSIKIYLDGKIGTWAYFNHYALPIGARKGASIRALIHEQAKLNRIRLVCHAQSEEIANYYIKENPNGENLGGKRPLIVWDYSDSKDKLTLEKFMEKHTKFSLSNLFGINSIRNSGQLPIKPTKQKILLEY